MQDWNVVVSVVPQHYQQAMKLLKAFGEVQRSGFFNIVVMRVADVDIFLDQLHRLVGELPLNRQAVSRVMPITTGFTFQDPQAFEEKARQALAGWAAQLRDKSFHVRMRRRGFKGRLSSLDEEQFLDHFLLEQVRMAGGESRIDFADPDLIIAVETLGQRAGVSLWNREQLQRYPLVRID